tara:strand:+ start:590 stop:880 length:291 start_codon:yes stop_codon:yes gene_type:complete
MKMMIPTRGKVIISRETKGEQTTEQGIVYTEKQMDHWIRGKVQAIGQGKIHDNGHIREAEFSIGDMVIYDMRKVNGYDAYDIVDFDDVIGVICESE